MMPASTAPGRFSTLLSLALWVAGWLALLLMLGPMAFAWPAADDFQRAAAAERFGPLVPVWREYVVWSGRWTAHIFNYGHPWLADLRLSYPIALLAVFGLALAALARAAMLVLRGGPVAGVGLALGMLLLMWLSHGDVGQSFYWRTGAVENLLGPAAVLLGLATVVAEGAGRSLSLAGRCAALLLIAAAPGLHELYGLMQVLGLLVILACALTGGRPVRGFTWIALAVAVVGFVVVFAAPGNAVRGELVGERSVAAAAALALGQSGALAARWLSDPALWLASTLALGIWLREAVSAAADPRPAAVGLLGWCCALLTLVAGGSWALGSELPARTAAALHLFFLAGWFTALRLCVAPRLAGPIGRAAPKALLPGVMLAGLVGLGTWTLRAPSTASMLADRGAGLSEFRWQVLERDRVLRAAARAGLQDVTLEPLDLPPRVYSAEILFLSEDPTHPFNMALARFYGIGRIRLAPAVRVAVRGEPG